MCKHLVGAERLRPPNGEHFKYHNFERMYLQQKQAHRLCHTERCSHAPTVFRLDYMSSQHNHAGYHSHTFPRWIYIYIYIICIYICIYEMCLKLKVYLRIKLRLWCWIT